MNPNFIAAKLEVTYPVTLHGKAPPPRRWIVDGWVPVGVVTLLYGDGGLGKSILGMQLATACAIGGKWLGMDVTPVKALYVSCEDDLDELNRRQADINSQMGVEFGDLENLVWRDQTGQWDSSLMQFFKFDDKPPEPSDLFGQIQDAAHDFGAQLVILDSLHDVFDGEENSRKHARRFVRLLTTLARDIDGAVVMLAHPSLDGLRSGSGTSGSTAWNNACRSRLYFRRPNDIEADTDAADTRILRRMKSNYARSGDEITVRWRSGCFICDVEPTGIVRDIEDKRIDRLFLACLDAATEQRRALSDSKNAPNYAPRIMAKMTQAEGARQRDMETAMQRLFNAGAIRVGSPFVKANRHHATGLIRASSDNVT